MKSIVKRNTWMMVGRNMPKQTAKKVNLYRKRVAMAQIPMISKRLIRCGVATKATAKMNTTNRAEKLHWV